MPPRDKKVFLSTLDTFSSKLPTRSPVDFDLPSVFKMAKRYQLDPLELLGLVGPQQLRIDSDIEEQSHRDVLAIEAVARVSVAIGVELDAIPVIEGSDVALNNHVRHIQSCTNCGAAALRFVQQFPTDDAIAQARRFGSA